MIQNKKNKISSESRIIIIIIKTITTHAKQIKCNFKIKRQFNKKNSFNSLKNNFNLNFFHFFHWNSKCPIIFVRLFFPCHHKMVFFRLVSFFKSRFNIKKNAKLTCILNKKVLFIFIHF